MNVFSGTRYDIGRQLGALFASHIRRDVEDCRESPPPVRDLSSVLLATHDLVTRLLPQVAEELRGMAEGAGVRPLDLLLTFYEELWDAEDQETGCTDIVAAGVATFDGQTLMGHNNDEAPEAPPPFLLRLAPVDGPVVTGVALGGTGFSVGVNSYGLVLSGNQVTARDVKPGLPRLLLVRAALDQPSIEEALKVLAHPARASSYNNVLADDMGQVISVEGSGRHMQIVMPKANGVLTHSNHYPHPKMKPVEGKGDFRSTKLREQRSCQLMDESAGLHTLETLASVLRDHRGFPVSICRHGEDAVTGFSVLFEPEVRRFWFVTGHPCLGRFLPFSY